jgi:hypothetical protein
LLERGKMPHGLRLEKCMSLPAQVAELDMRMIMLREAFSMLSGSLAALEVAVLAIADTHPDKKLLLDRLHLGFEAMEALLLAESPSEATLNHFRNVRARFDSQANALGRGGAGRQP